MIKDAWLEELTKHPYFSCKYPSNHLEKRGKGIHMLKGQRKIVAVKRKKDYEPLKTRLSDFGGIKGNPLLYSEKQVKRKKVNEGETMFVEKENPMPLTENFLNI